MTNLTICYKRSGYDIEECGLGMLEPLIKVCDSIEDTHAQTL